MANDEKAIELLREFLKTDRNIKDAVITTDKFGNGLLEVTMDDGTDFNFYIDGHRPLYVAWDVLRFFEILGVFK